MAILGQFSSMGCNPQREAPQALRKNGAWPFGGCNLAAASSALSLFNLPSGPVKVKNYSLNT